MSELEGMSEKEVLEKALISTMDLMKAMKSSACEENKGHTDLNPMVVVGLDIKDDEGNEGLGGQVVEMELSKGEHPVDVLPKMLSDLAESGLHQFRFIMFLVEGFARRATTEEGQKELANLTEDGGYERGALEKDFHENPASNVEEGIIGTAFAWTGESATLAQFYKYGDDGLPIYDEENADVTTYDKGNEQQGKVPDVFYKFIKYCHLVQMSKSN